MYPSVSNVYRDHIARVERLMSVVRVPRGTYVLQAVRSPLNIPVLLVHTRAAPICLIKRNALSAHLVVIVLKDRFLLRPVPLDRMPLRTGRHHPVLVHSPLVSPALRDLIALKGQLLPYLAVQDLTHLRCQHPALSVLVDFTAGK